MRLPRSDLEFLAQDTKTVLLLLDRLATMGSQVAVLVRDLVWLVPRDDLGQVKPLWKVLAETDPQDEATASLLVDRLLDVAMREKGLAELQRQPAFVPEFVTNEVRERVYPFTQGLSRRSNLVTLLAWLDWLQPWPHFRDRLTRVNRFLEAMATDPDAFSNIERDRRRRQATISVNLFYVGWVITLCALVGAVGVVGWTWYREGWQALLLTSEIPFWENAWYLLPGVAALLLGILLHAVNILLNAVNPTLFRLSGDDTLVVFISYLTPYSNFWFGVWATIVSIPHSVAFHALLSSWSLDSYLALSTLVVFWTIWLPATELFANEPLYLRKRNPFVDLYEDSMSEHWVSAVPA
jgi:hypothetical protein